MPRGVAYLLAWSVATTLMVGASWLGINSVLSTGAPARTAPLSAAELRRAAPQPSLTPPPSPTPVRRSPATPPGASSSTPSSGPSRAAPRSPAPSPESTGWLAEADGRGGTAYRRTFRMQGGEATIWFARGEIRVLSTVARSGFAVDIERPALDSTTVTFYSSRHRSRIWATWRSGPYAELNEGR